MPSGSPVSRRERMPPPMTTSLEIPTISLEPSPGRNRADISLAIAAACINPGFFQVTSHSLSNDLLRDFRAAMEQFFSLEDPVKSAIRRHSRNARGYFDNELTKRRVDWKECLDVGAVPRRRSLLAREDGGEVDVADTVCLDGINQWPDAAPGFREVVDRYFGACAELSDDLATHMVEGLRLHVRAKMGNGHDGGGECGVQDGGGSGGGPDERSCNFLKRLRENHSSYLRMNHYPPCPPDADPGTLGISPHTDAGFLTILLQDDRCHSLQVSDLEAEGAWTTVVPTPGALTINTGDMAQVFSGGIFRAPPHRVLTNGTFDRYSAPFFYNPPYDEMVAVSHVAAGAEQRTYHPILWGYFRAVRFAGDLTDWGVDEIQVDHFHTAEEKKDGRRKVEDGLGDGRHVARQKIFRERAKFDNPFDVDVYRELLMG